VGHTDESDPEHEALLADSLGLALLVVLDIMNPAERLAFVLHDLFDVPFEEIAPIVGVLQPPRASSPPRPPPGAGKVASKTRKRLRHRLTHQRTAANREIVEAFLAASRNGGSALLAALVPTSPSAPCSYGDGRRLEWRKRHGARRWRGSCGRAHAAQLALIDRRAVWGQGDNRVSLQLHDYRWEDWRYRCRRSERLGSLTWRSRWLIRHRSTKATAKVQRDRNAASACHTRISQTQLRRLHAGA
jgi:hypothetical protein